MLRSLLAAHDDGGELAGLGACHLHVRHEAVFVGLALDGGLERRHAEVGDAEGVEAAAVGEDYCVLAFVVSESVPRDARLGRGDFDAGVLEGEGVGASDAAEDDVGGRTDLGHRRDCQRGPAQGDAQQPEGPDTTKNRTHSEIDLVSAGGAPGHRSASSVRHVFTGTGFATLQRIFISRSLVRTRPVIMSCNELRDRRAYGKGR